MHYVNDLAFLDFEASSLADDSWPVEIGLSWVTDDGEIETHSRLICPHPDWPLSAWSEKSAAVHGIDRATLEDDGHDAAEVARWFMKLTAGRRVASDAPEFDAPWLRRLLTAGGFDPEAADRLHGCHELLEPMLPMAAMDRYYERLARSRAPHRAGPDAQRLAKAFRRAMDAR